MHSAQFWYGVYFQKYRSYVLLHKCPVLLRNILVKWAGNAVLSIQPFSTLLVFYGAHTSKAQAIGKNTLMDNQSIAGMPF